MTWTADATGVPAVLNPSTVTTSATSNQFYRVTRTALAPYDP